MTTETNMISVDSVVAGGTIMPIAVSAVRGLAVGTRGWNSGGP